MTKQIEVAIDTFSFRQIETFVDELSNELQIENTYYGNILASLAHLFELAGKAEVEKLVLGFETGHDGLAFELRLAGGNFSALKLSEESITLVNHLTDSFEVDRNGRYFKLFFDTKSVFGLMANKRAEHLRDYLKSCKTNTSAYNDSLQRG